MHIIAAVAIMCHELKFYQIDIIVEPDFPVCTYFFNILPIFWNPVIFFRLLVDTFLATPFSTKELPGAHTHILNLIRRWLKHSFKTMAPVQKDLKIFFNQVSKAGGIYKTEIDKLLDSVVEAGVCPFCACYNAHVLKILHFRRTQLCKRCIP